MRQTPSKQLEYVMDFCRCDNKPTDSLYCSATLDRNSATKTRHHSLLLFFIDSKHQSPLLPLTSAILNHVNASAAKRSAEKSPTGSGSRLLLLLLRAIMFNHTTPRTIKKRATFFDFDCKAEVRRMILSRDFVGR